MYSGKNHFIKVITEVYVLLPGYSKTYTVALGRADSLQLNDVAFLNLGKLTTEPPSSCF